MSYSCALSLPETHRQDGRYYGWRWILCSLTIVVSACATSAQKQADQITDNIAALRGKSETCWRDARGSVPGNSTHTFLYFAGDSDITKYMNQNYLNDIQSESLIQFYQLSQQCVKIDTAGLTIIHPYLLEVNSARENAIERIYIAFIQRQITIGKGNESLKEIYSLGEQAWQEASRSINAELNTAHQAEIQQRLSAMAAVNQSIQQQQQIELQRQQILQQNRPKFTNCSVGGNNINCYSY